MSTNRYPHFDVVVAWMNGEKIQRQNPDGSWSDEPVYNSSMESLPAFYVDTKYRIKPETRKYRVGLFKDSTGDIYFSTIQDKGELNSAQSYHHFVKWVTDWIEVEV